MWEYVGMSRNAEGLQIAIKEIRALREEFYQDVFIPGKIDEYNYELEKASKVADFLELAEVMAVDALNRNESCGGHFREEYRTPEGEAMRNDKDFTYVAAWEWSDDLKHKMHKEELEFKDIELKTRSYK
jgi:succinate dehydrogenase / fumarate reductase flavoprotein subunit